MQFALSLYLSLTAGLDDVREWRHLPDGLACEKRHNEAAEFCWHLNRCLNAGVTWDGISLEIEDANTLRNYWYSAWCVTCSSVKWPTWTWEQRREHYARLREIEWELREHLPHGQMPPSLPVWRWERR